MRVPHYGPVDVPDYVDYPEVAVRDDEVGEGWDEYPVEVGETVASYSGYDGAGS